MTEFSRDTHSNLIQQLDRTLINKIAAGEVIERPASVIKELVENSFDAGATAVEITARKAGTTYLAVTDNGCGIPAEQVRLAFSRHATSKIKDVDDLFAVRSYGFRGEALPSIASVSHLTLTTRYFDEATGTRIVYEGGREIEMRPVSAPVGTTVEVSHLFFNTPARRKFMKAETTESRQIIRVAERMALGRPSAALSLMLNERRQIQLAAGRPIAERMGILFGVKPDAIVEYDVEMGEVSYLVYLAHPDQARHDRSRICLFVNGRSVTSSTIIHAITSGYGEFLPAGRFPLAAAYLTIDPDRLDVNVHPTKAEVRLSEERAIHDNLYRIVKKALRDWRMVPAEGMRPNHQSPPSTGGYGRPYRPGEGQAGPSLFHGGGNIAAPGSGAPLSYQMPVAPPSDSPACDNTRPAVEMPVPETPTIATNELDESQITYLGKTGRTYLVLTIRGELYVVDQHAAHERILYETALRQVENGSGTTQKTLFPETVELSGEEFLTFETSRELLNKLGFDIEPFGGNAIIINGMPPVFRDRSPQRILRKLLDDIQQLNKAGGELIKSVAQSMACRASVMAGDRLTSEEVQALVMRLFATNNPYCCPHGRPTFIKISPEELDGRFGRT